MKEKRLVNGYIDCMEKPYVFTYDGELLQLTPKDEKTVKPYDFLVNRNLHMDVLSTRGLNGEGIYFLNCNLKVNGLGYAAKPAGYIYVEDNTDGFDSITFTGGMLDYFYRPNQIVDDKKTNYDYGEGGGILVLKPFEDITKKHSFNISGKEGIATISITLPGEPYLMQINYNFGKPKTRLRLSFANRVAISDFRQVYMWVYNFLAFLNFRRDITLGEIRLWNKNESEKFEEIGYVYLNEKDRQDISNVDRTIGYFLVRDGIEKLLQVINNEKLNMLFLPKTEKESHTISPKKYLICCTSFESVFNFVFPKAREENNQVAKDTKRELLDHIEQQREACRGIDGKKRKELKKYSDIIELLDFSLEEKFQYCLKEKFSDIAEKYIQRQRMNGFNVTDQQIDEISNNFAVKRNHLTHNELEYFEDIHILAYTLAQVFIYVMILDKCGLDTNTIIQAIDKVL